MASSKINRTGLSETPLGKSSLRVGKLTRLVTKSESNSPSPTQQSRLSLERSSSNSKPSSTDKRSPKVLTPPEKTQTRAVKGSESSQPRSVQIKEDLRKANELIASLENEKAKALVELKEAREEAEKASGKLDEALKTQKMAQEKSEIEKFEAVEAGIEAVQRKEEEWKKELENVKNQHASDSAALLLVTQELEKANQELAAAKDAKIKVLSQADDASKLAAIHAEKVEILSSELIRLKALLDSTREKETISKNEIASKLGAEIVVLERELEKARSFEAKVEELEMIIEQLNVDLEAAKIAETYAHGSADEWQNKAKELEKRLEEANMLERSASVSLGSVTKQLEGSNSRLHDMEFEITDLKKKIELLEMTAARKNVDLEKSERQLGIAKEELSKIEKEAEKLKNELETLNEEKNQALKKEQDATSSVQRLLEEKNKILSELESSKEEEEKSKKAMESLASALHEVSSESRELKEKLLSQGDQDYETQIEDLKLVIKATNKKYENMLDEARHEIDVLVNAVEQTKKQFESAMVDWEMREAGLVNHVKEFDEEVSSMGKEMNRLGNLVKRTKEEADAAWEKESQMRDSLKEVEDEVIYLQETLREAKGETLKLKGKMLDKETEFQSIVHENDELRGKHDDSLKKIKELSKLLEEALAKKYTEENSELSESEKDYDLLPKVVEFSEENGHRSAEEKSSKVKTLDGMNMKLEEDAEKKEKKEHSPDDATVEEMWESCQIEKKEGFHKEKPEQESAKYEEEDSNMIDQSEKNSPVNGLTGEDELVKEKDKKKKKTLFGKVGNLLKKKGPMNQK
ncbi:PREDICTED: WEB family protein At3g02930, chloroplastic-like isoform X1 [Camelina sativa]|uniref:WEB family protein At3g02930, chloroplastic-like isoform X1 n=1 Tax=Camelina sativa TaxID=90675 RepID=A0ABM1RKH4_CAMSA|nr:PREDICTED: WEB family protein At3g02930, chloroplastic-like isoform X2 [Camelina sativa]XP_010503646.1 PREDICTED: WEB family protein At3g02930, chloroplastic-like isoform X2 [Camelina sativa]XP_019099512.1 PREDICTED: WEB family protein At3g02930, chloroplastic-like isoform X1 [Camelina sativa]